MAKTRFITEEICLLLGWRYLFTGKNGIGEELYFGKIIGVDEYGKKELVAIDDGFRESKDYYST